MEMSADYLRQTAAYLKGRGYALEEADVDYGCINDKPCRGHRYICTRPGERLILEVVQNPKEGERYFLELAEYHGLTVTSFPLDSWKHFKDRVEFKFYALPENGLGLSFILR